MPTKTAFTVTSDNDPGANTYPDDGGSGWEMNISDPGLANQAVLRYNRIGTSGRTISYPKVDDVGFHIPKVRFMFLSAYGEVIPNTPILYLKFPGNFNLTNLSDYSKSDPIFAGGRDTYSAIANSALKEKMVEADLAGAAQEAINSIGAAGITGVEALQYAIRYGAANALGQFGSAGLSNIGQYEFNERAAVNPMAQLLYKGPQLRRYQFPFSLTPKNREDSDNIKKIISTFRVASSPSVPDISGYMSTVNQALGISVQMNIGYGNSFTFGYPHLTQFTVGFTTPRGQQKKIFRSKPCVIESVSVDYGGQKMTFFEDGMPTEMNLVIQLSEIMPRTLGDAAIEALSPDSTLI